MGTSSTPAFNASKLPSPQQCASKRWPPSSLEQISQVIVQEAD
jgi:hypothetical protein